MRADDPRMADVVDGIARSQYAQGLNGIEIGEQWISNCITALIEVMGARATNPAAYPCYPEDSPEAAARTIIARLLDAGWRPADPECLELEAEPTAAQEEK